MNFVPFECSSEFCKLMVGNDSRTVGGTALELGHRLSNGAISNNLSNKEGQEPVRIINRKHCNEEARS